MLRGHLSNSVAVTGINTGFVAAKAVVLDTLDAQSVARGVAFIPDGAVLSHVIVNATAAAGVGALEIAGWAEVTCDTGVFGPSQASSSVQLGLTTVTKAFTVMPLDSISPTYSAAVRLAKKLFATLKADAATFTVPVGGMELHWRLPDHQGA